MNCLSSSTGKYHPEDELNGRGTIPHAKRVFRLIPAVAEAPEADRIDRHRFLRGFWLTASAPLGGDFFVPFVLVDGTVAI